MKDKNILFILSRYPAVGGGIEKVTTYLSDALVNEGYQVAILSFGKEQIDNKGSYILPDQRVKILMMPDGIENVESEANSQYINQIIRDLSINTIVLQDSYSNAYRILYHLETKTKIIVTEHNIPTAWIDDKIAEFKETKVHDMHTLIRKIMFPIIYIKNVRHVREHHKLVYSLADNYVVLANSYIGMVKKLSSTDDKKHKLLAINNPITIATPDCLDFKDKKKEVLFVGRLVSQKGVDYLLDIWKLFSNENTGWILRIIGDGDLKGEMEHRVKNEGIKEVVFEGAQTDVFKYYVHSSIVCVTSRYEGWPLVLTEAMTYGNVVMAFDSYDAVHDIISDGKDGFIIKAFDCKDYARKLYDLTVNDKQREAMGRQAIVASKRFTMPTILKKWEEIL